VPFRCLLVLPNYPEGAMSKPAVQVVFHYQMRTLDAAKGSLVQRAKDKAEELGLDWRDFLQVACLRQHGVVSGHHVAEQIYVHSKLLIVDDRVVICGSANINDRSLSGNRDSEVCVLLETSGDMETPPPGSPLYWPIHHASARSISRKVYDAECKFEASNTSELGESELKKHWWGANQFAYSLRSYIWATLLGEGIQEDGTPSPEALKGVVNPVSNATWACIRNTARRNADIYSKAFPYMPSDHHDTVEKYLEDQETEIEAARRARASSFKAQPSKIAVRELSGVLVDYPLQFLRASLEAGDLLPTIGEKEALVPLATFT